MNPIHFARAMRSRGWTYTRFRRGFALFIRRRTVNGRDAYTTHMVSIPTLVRATKPIDSAVEMILADSDARFGRLAGSR